MGGTGLAGALSQRGREIKGFVGRHVLAQEGGLSRSTSIEFNAEQVEVLGHWFAINLVVRPAVIAENVGNSPLVQLSQFLCEVLERESLDVPAVPIAADALIRRVHVHDVFRPGVFKYFAVVASDHLGLALEQPRSTGDLISKCLRAHAAAPVVRTLVEITVGLV